MRSAKSASSVDFLLLLPTKAICAALIFGMVLLSQVATAVAQSSRVGTFGYADSWVAPAPKTATTAVPRTMPVAASQVFLPTPSSPETLSSGAASAPVPQFGVPSAGVPSIASTPGLPLCPTPAACCKCCEGPCDECGRRFAFDISGVFYRRSQPQAQSLFRSPVVANEAIDASHFGFDWTSGFETGLILYDQETQTDFEFRGLFPGSWTSHQVATFSGSTVQIDTTPPLATTGPRTGFASYETKFWSAEANARYRLRNADGITLLAGFRTLQLTDDLNARLVSSVAGIPDELVDTSAENRLYGFHAGADYVFRSSCCWCFRMKGRFGMYGNNGSQQSNLTSLAAPPVVFPAGGGNNSLAWHGEFGLDAKYKVSECVNLLFAYRLMYLDGVALAPEQLQGTNFVSQAGYNSGGSVLLNGFHLGVELVY